MDDQEQVIAAPDGRVLDAAAALSSGGMVVLVDYSRDDVVGSLLAPAEAITPRQVAFMVRHSTGILFAQMHEQWNKTLDLDPMVLGWGARQASTGSVDHVSTSRGSSASDRAVTFRALADPTTLPGELRRPGHVFPVCARPGGVLRRAGCTEAAVDLLEMAGRPLVGVTAELVAEDGDLMRGEDLSKFASSRGLPKLAISDLERHRSAMGQQVVGIAAVPYDARRHELTRAV